MSHHLLSDFVPQLTNLTAYSPATTRPLNLGGQNFTHCCLKAVNDSLTILNDNLSFTPSSHFLPDLTIPELVAAVQNDEFPCGATWTGDPAGAPVVQVSYEWCVSECSGWEISHLGKLNEWVGPLVQFILPSLAFCLNIPRSQKLAIPEKVFQAHPRNVFGFASYWIRLLGAVLLMMVDTMVWLSICFAFAGPMLLSAVYEFVLDRKVLEFLRPPKSQNERPKIPGRVKAQLLLAVVVGNLRISTGTAERRISTSNSRRPSHAIDPEMTGTNTREDPFGDTWKRVMVIVDEYETSRLSGDAAPKKVSLSTKLKALLNSQASFGSTVGAPILFFIGGFVYTVLDILNELGDNDMAHALAFGMWWMTIPYLAIISCAMLAANSPSALQGIVYDGGASAARDHVELSFWDQLKMKIKTYKPMKILLENLDGYQLIEATSEGQFKTVTLWNRGPNKRRWVQEAIKEYSSEYNENTAKNKENLITPEKLRDGLKMDFGDLWNIFWGTSYLLITPSLLAFLTSYNTPRKGLTCRSMTYLVYGISQICEMLLWVWEAWLKVQYGIRWSGTKMPAKSIIWWGQVFVGFFGVLAAVGGTLMQTLGVYRACACRIPAKYWVRPNDPDAYMILSSNFADSIVAAERWWVVTGTVAVALLAVVCALAWWHQRRLRKVYRDEADSLNDDAAALESKSPETVAGTSSQVTPVSQSTQMAHVLNE
ncbi:uncharacterized protein BCR38DRAFT_412408 [Pseudomassariella vexata]|uniref:Uncharacterized protein n=1 Tax=Pseudomassariella vexata TaxID=1141098 RepID=A0A1Y2DLT9_9PEZI|nr:uncharacterized protein BCR38DRAFT_412408 [Pseudomassariella vexata]ORY60227.1 hypothetical protein BCR38DRAFT_412408 [Pseudomassariella vexata]